MAKENQKLSIFYMLRIARNLTAHDVAEMMGKSYAWVFSIESERRKPSMQGLYAYARKFNIPEKFLVYYLSPEHKPSTYEEFLCIVLNCLVYGIMPKEVEDSNMAIVDLYTPDEEMEGED